MRERVETVNRERPGLFRAKETGPWPPRRGRQSTGIPGVPAPWRLTGDDGHRRRTLNGRAT